MEFRKTSMPDAVRAELKEAKAKFKEATKINGAIVTESLQKEEGISVADIKSMDHKEVFFEIRKGLSDCSAIGEAIGFEVNRCSNGVRFEYGDGVGFPQSEMLIKPNNGGFPIMVWFNGHGCDVDRIEGFHRLPKVEYGFSPTYSAGSGECEPASSLYDPTSTAYYQTAGWYSERFEPMSGSTFTGVDGSGRGCERGKFASYIVRTADVCWPSEWGYGGSKIDVAKCDSGSVEYSWYYDSACTNFDYAYPRRSGTRCVFDTWDFISPMDDVGEMEYFSHRCHAGSLPTPLRE